MAAEPKAEAPNLPTLSDEELWELSIDELERLEMRVQGVLYQKRQSRAEKLREEIVRLKIDPKELFPELAASVVHSDKPKRGPKEPTPEAADDLEAPEKGATYQNPDNPEETWTAGAKKGRAPAWVTVLREKKELHLHRIG